MTIRVIISKNLTNMNHPSTHIQSLACFELMYC